MPEKEKAELEQLKSDMYKAMTEAFHKVKSVQQWGNEKREFSNLKILIRKFVEIDTDSAPEKALEMMRHFYKLKMKGAADFWKNAPYTPSGMLTKWDYLLSDLDGKAVEAQQVEGPEIEDMENPDAVDLIESLQMIYNRDYPAALKRRMSRAIGNWPRRYILALHSEIVREFKASSTRPLPDAATMNDAIKALGPSETYVEPVKTKALPGPDKSQEYRDTVEKMIHNIDGVLNESCKEALHDMRVKKARGYASKWELHWIWCMDEGGGTYLPPESGPYSELFEHSTRQNELFKERI